MEIVATQLSFPNIANIWRTTENAIGFQESGQERVWEFVYTPDSGGLTRGQLIYVWSIHMA